MFWRLAPARIIKTFVWIAVASSLVASPIYAQSIDHGALKMSENAAVVQNFARPVQLLPPADREGLSLFLDGLYFIDFGHAAPELLEVFLGNRRIADVRFPFMYDQNNENAFVSYRNARNFLVGRAEPLSFPLIRRLHEITMPWISSPDNGPGHIRKHFVYGPEFEQGLHSRQLDAIRANPYLHFKAGTGIYADVFTGQGEAVNGEYTRGAIIYPRAQDLKPEVLDRLSIVNPDLAKKIRLLQFKLEAAPLTPIEDVTQDLVTGLLQERILTFSKSVSDLALLDPQERTDEYIKLIAQFQKDFVSIHPFPDGNGRMSRLLLGFLAEQKGLPIPRLVYPNEDIFWPTELWVKQVRMGMLSTLALNDDLERTILSGARIEELPSLFTPVVPDLTAQGREEFGSYLKHHFQSVPSLKSDLQKDPVGLLRRLRTEFKPTLVVTCAQMFRAG